MLEKKSMKICLVEDEKLVRTTIRDELKEHGYNVVDFGNPFEALEYIKEESPEIVISDVKMPKMDGIELLTEIKKHSPETEVIIITAFGSVANAVETIKLGAFNYLTKPFEFDELDSTIRKIVNYRRITNSNLQFRKHFEQKYSLDSLIGNSPQIKRVKEEISLVANTNSCVLLTGETGTGKEVVANIIHYSSNRAEKPLIKVSCAILSEDVIESELFGHEKGAFTGAEKTRIGRFEEANYGTIFLDDIDDVPLSVQVKLLRALQENEIERVGSNKPIKIDVRVVASTKVNLEKLVEEGKFREDLYYRLNVFPINIPPLRNRKEDIRILIKKFVEHFAEGRSITVEEDFFEILTQYHWPGNVRQLKNFIERCMILAADGVIHKGMIPREYCTSENMLSIDDLDGKSLPDIISEFEMNIIKSFLDKNGWNKTKTAEELGIPLNTLRSKMEKFGLNN